MECQTHFQEPSNEIGWEPLLPPEVLILEVRHKVVGLTPKVHGLLRQENISLVVRYGDPAQYSNYAPSCSSPCGLPHPHQVSHSTNAYLVIGVAL